MANTTSVAIPVHLICSQIDQDFYLVEPLLIPDISVVRRDLLDAKEAVLKRVSRFIRKAPPNSISQYVLDTSVSVASIDWKLASTAPNPAWAGEIPIRFWYVHWKQSNGFGIYVPQLRIAAFADKKSDVEPAVVKAISQGLERAAIPSSVHETLQLLRTKDVTIRKVRMRVAVPVAKTRLIERIEEPKESLLKEIGRHLDKESLSSAYEREKEVKELARSLAGPKRSSVLLVGPSGVGKTAIVYQLVKSKSAFGLEDAPFWSTSGSQIISGISGFGGQEERMLKLVEEVRKQNAIIHVEQLMELVEVGKAEGRPQGLASILRPAIANGDLPCVAECTPEQESILEREEPDLVQSFHIIRIAEPTAEKLLSILQKIAVEPPLHKKTESKRQRLKRLRREKSSKTPSLPKANTIAVSTLQEICRLFTRFGTASRAPGRHIRLLRNLLSDVSSLGPREIEYADVHRAIATETGLPLFLLDAKAKIDLDEIREWFQSRLLGQSAPVDSLLNLLATLKTSLNRGGRPLGSYLLVGPTGTGKTEFAKTTAEFFYHDRSRLVRFDMNEYNDFISIDKLIGGLDRAEGLLVRTIRKHPFCVLLFDEFEKAHPRFFDLMLQILGEGKLTDSVGRVADFSNAIILMTSNLGVESFREMGLGFQGTANAKSAHDHFFQAAKRLFRPELLNRMDAIIPFDPLPPEVVQMITRRELDKVLLRQGIRHRPHVVQFAPETIRHLSEKNYQPRYGARPIKRACEQGVVSKLSESVLSPRASHPLQYRFEVKEEKLVLDIVDLPNAKSRQLNRSEELVEIANIQAVRRESQLVNRSSVLGSIRNEISRIEHELQVGYDRRKRMPRTKTSPYSEEFFSTREAKVIELQGKLAELNRIHESMSEIETTALTNFASSKTIDLAEYRVRRQALSEELKSFMFRLYHEVNQRAALKYLVVLSDNNTMLRRIISAYGRALRRNIEQRDIYVIRPGTYLFADNITRGPRARSSQPEQERTGSNLDANRIEKIPSKILACSNDREPAQLDETVGFHRWDVNLSHNPFSSSFFPDGIGISLQLQGQEDLLFESEQGYHEAKLSSGTAYFWVRIIENNIARFVPPAGFSRRSFFRNGFQSIRSYRFSEKRIVHSATNESTEFEDEGFDITVINMLWKNAEARVRKFFENK